MKKDIYRGYAREGDITDINKIEDIDRTTDEGKLLLMAINRLNFTVDTEITMNEVIEKLKFMYKEIYG